MMTHIFAESFILTFLAEWGDRSQISTIILAARDVSCDDNVVKLLTSCIEYLKVTFTYLLPNRKS